MRQLERLFVTLFALVVLGPAGLAFGQTQSIANSAATAAAGQAPATVRRLSIDDAVKLALEQNLGIQIEKVNPQIQDLVVAQARNFWTPVGFTTLNNNSTTTQSNSVFSGGLTEVNDKRFNTQFGVNQNLKTGANYSLGWTSFRATSTNLFTNFDPQLSSRLDFNFTQPLLRNFKIDTTRQQIAVSRKDRDTSDLQLRATIAATTRNVKNAYWELAYQIASLAASQESLDLAKRVLSDNEKRVQIGTMAPIDIVEAQAEVARNEEAVIISQAAIERAEDVLRILILGVDSPDFWNTKIEPSDSPVFESPAVNVESAVSRALSNRLDILIAKNNLEREDVNILYFKNQSMPNIDANINYSSAAVGGTQLSPVQSLNVGTIQRSIIANRGYGSVLGDVFSNTYPVWQVGVTVSYPIGASTAEANLARSRLQKEQGQTQLKQLEVNIATQVRDLARQVQTNEKRVETTRVSRELAERRLEAAEKKFAAGIETSFFVFQAQRDLSQARTNLVRAVADLNKSLVDLEAVQEAPLTAAGTGTAAIAAGAAGR